ncbi:MAG: PspC domain-containing protein [Chitinophagales bacterium]
MKKIININLSGRVIPIEDSAYEKLQAYIESLRRYFANEEGRDEIINDIESRVAELMNEKIRKGSNAITDADIEEIISSMGRVEDFEKTETESAKTTASQSSGPSEQTFTKKRGRLYRDNSDKILGGVASGIANYLDIDPAVIRIILILFGFTGTGLLLYIILWIVLPAKDLYNYTGKRLFRNPDDKVIAGVAGGLAAYFKIQAWVIRLILLSPLLLNIIFGTFNGIFFSWHRDIFPNVFIAPFTGTFILAYIILWMVLPEARSPFEKMEMRGEKVDVNSIRQNVQEGMSDFRGRMQNWSEEVKTSAQQFGERAKDFANTKGKAWANEVAENARPAARGVAHIIGVIFKAFFIFIAGSIVLGLFAALMVLIFGGVTSWPVNNFLWTSNLQKLSAWGTLFFFITVPVVAFMTWLIRRIVHARSGRHHLGWIFGGLWVVGWVCAMVFAASIAKDLRIYDRANAIEIPLTQPAKGRMIVRVTEPEIRYNGSFWWIHDDENTGWDVTDDTMRYNNIKIRYDKSDDTAYHVRLYKYSAGSTLNDAQNRASQTIFNINYQDSILNMGSGLAIEKSSKFRGQGVIVEIAIPAGKKIKFDESVLHAYNPWVVRRSWRERRYWGQHWQSDWDYDDFFDLKPDVDYTMGDDGKLLSQDEQQQNSTDKNYHYNKKEDLKKNIQEREKKMEEERKQIEEDKKKLNDSIPASNTKKETMDPIKDDEANTKVTVNSPLSFTALFN